MTREKKNKNKRELKTQIPTGFGNPVITLYSKILVNVLQYDHTSFVTMATYWVPDLPDIRDFAGHLWRSILKFANGNSSA